MSTTADRHQIAELVDNLRDRLGEGETGTGTAPPAGSVPVRVSPWTDPAPGAASPGSGSATGPDPATDPGGPAGNRRPTGSTPALASAVAAAVRRRDVQIGAATAAALAAAGVVTWRVRRR